jgi:hypothetical protein
MPYGTSPGAYMSRRALVVFAAVVVFASLTGCSESVTAPRQPTLAPSAPQPDLAAQSRCKGGYILSEGRCP